MPGDESGPSRRGRSHITVLVADDHPIVREGVQVVLQRQPDVRVVGAVGEASAAIRDAMSLNPDVVVMDISMPGMNGIDATRIIGEQVPGTAVIVLSMHSSPMIVRRAVDAGARGYVCKDMGTDELVRAVREAAAGKRYFAQGMLQGLLATQNVRSSERTMAALTTTERNILKLVADGRSNAQIAVLIGLTRRTVETYRLRLMHKLGVENLAALVKYAIRHGMVPLD